MEPPSRYGRVYIFLKFLRTFRFVAFLGNLSLLGLLHSVLDAFAEGLQHILYFDPNSCTFNQNIVFIETLLEHATIKEVAEYGFTLAVALKPFQHPQVYLPVVPEPLAISVGLTIFKVAFNHPGTTCTLVD